MLATLRRALSQPTFWVLAIFVASRVVFRWMGVRFDADPVSWFWQIIEPDLLQTRLLESVFFHHAQPPAFNLLLGAAMKVAPGHWQELLAWLWMGMGALLAWSLLHLVRGLGVPSWPAAVATTVFMLSPPVVLYENWLFYTYPEAILLTASGLLALRFAKERRARQAWALFSVMALLALTRSAFHLAWYVGLAGFVLVATGTWRTRAIFAAAGSLVLVLAVYVKNAVVFGAFASSTWFGMNLGQIALRPLPQAERTALVEGKVLSPLALENPFQSLSTYPADRAILQGPDVPVLRRELRGGRSPNFNRVEYIAISRAFARDSIAAIRKRPDLYLDVAGRAALLYFTPASDYPFLKANRAKLTRLEAIYNRALFGTFAAPTAGMQREWLSGPEVKERFAWTWFALVLLGAAGAVVAFIRDLRRRGSLSPETTARMFLLANVAWLSLVGILLEFGENNRLRFPIDPLVVPLAMATLVSMAAAVRARWRSTSQREGGAE